MPVQIIYVTYLSTIDIIENNGLIRNNQYIT